MSKKMYLLFVLANILLLTMTNSCATKKSNLNRARVTLDSLYSKYSVPDSYLLRETFPFDESYSASYLATAEQARPNPYSYLWPYSGTLSATVTLYESSKDKKILELIESKVIPGLQMYFDDKRLPAAYSSYINTAPISDRFYDDNIWIGIDFIELYSATKNQKYLDKSKLIWKFIQSGTDDKLGGGVYWCEQKKESKNTCSNAPGAVYALKLFKHTNDSLYFKEGKDLYHWTKKHLQDPTDYLYFDNISLTGRIEKPKYSYNSGQMLQAAVLLYKITKENQYLEDARQIASSCFNHFFQEFKPQDQEPFRILKNNDVWFNSIMVRGFKELYDVDKNKRYMEAIEKSLDYAWDNARDENGLFSKNWVEKKNDKRKWLLTQAAMAEMYARISK